MGSTRMRNSSCRFFAAVMMVMLGPEEILAHFSHTLWDEVDIEALKAQLLGVVRETIQPAQVALWLKE